MKPATDKMGMTKQRKKMRKRMKQALYEVAVRCA